MKLACSQAFDAKYFVSFLVNYIFIKRLQTEIASQIPTYLYESLHAR